MLTDLFKKNRPNWVPTDIEYRLVFQPVKGQWREVSNNLPRYNGVMLADYLSDVGISIPEGTTFLRLDNGRIALEYRDTNAYVRIDVRPSKFTQL